MPVLLLILLFGGVGCNREAKDRALVARWLARNCGRTGERELEEEIRRRGPAIERLFLEAFRNGPPESLEDDLLTAVEEHWCRLQIQINEPDAHALSAEDVAGMRAVSLAGGKAEALRRLRLNYRSAALAALGIIGREPGRDLLRRVAGDTESPYRHVAALAYQKAQKTR